jgi:ankyrin repeat protein
VRNGDFAFHKYALLHWLPHLHSLRDMQIPETQISEEFGRDVDGIQKNLGCPSDLIWDSSIEVARHATSGQFAAILKQVEVCYDKHKNNDGQKLPSELDPHLSKDTEETSFIHQQIFKIQSLIEEAVSSAKGSEKDFLLEAYGICPYQCPNISCHRYLHGYASPQERDSHLKGHQRQFKCPFPDCKMFSIGLPTKGSLDTHIDVFHVLTLSPLFSDLKPYSVWTALKDAIKADNEALVDSLSMEAIGKHGKPEGLVNNAITKKYINSARALIRHFQGSDDLHTRYEKKETLLGNLAETGDVALIREFLRLSNVEWTKYCFCSALYSANCAGQSEMFSFLLERLRLLNKTDVERCAKFIGKTARAGDSEKLSTMLDAIGRVCKSLDMASCCTNLAAEGRTMALKQVLAFFLENFSTQIRRIERFKNLVGLPIEDAADRLVRETAVVSNKTGVYSRNSLFQSAAFRGDTTELSRMLNLGVNINNFSGLYGTALQAASWKGHVQVVRWLLEHGAQAGTTGGQYGNAIAAAAAAGEVEILRMLLGTGQSASLEARITTAKSHLCLIQHPKTATPLHFAVAEMQEETVDFLLDAGADVEATDSNGNTALHMAVLGPYTPIFPYCQDGNWTSKLFAPRIRRSCSGIMTSLLGRSTSVAACVKLQNKNGDSPLHTLFIKGFGRSFEFRTEKHHPCAIELTRLLFDAEASFDQPNYEKITPRDTMIKIGGQLLEDLKKEIPTAWKDFGDLGTDRIGNFVPPETESEYQARDIAGLEETGKLTDSEETANTSSMFHTTWSTEDSHSSTDVIQWTAINGNETIPGPDDLTNGGYQWTDERYDASNPVFSSSTKTLQPEIAWPQPSSGLFETTQDPFMNPWTVDEDTEMVD